jgi:hypothetical protein
LRKALKRTVGSVGGPKRRLMTQLEDNDTIQNQGENFHHPSQAIENVEDEQLDNEHCEEEMQDEQLDDEHIQDEQLQNHDHDEDNDGLSNFLPELSNLMSESHFIELLLDFDAYFLCI